MIGSLYGWIQAHPLDLPIVMFVINVAISNLPDPDGGSSKVYRWFYGTSHGIIGGVGNVIFAAQSGKALPAAEVKTP